MRFLSVCSGIEAASVAWQPLGWKAVAFSEIEPFPCAVLAHHYPDTPNWGDMTNYKEWPDANVDLLCGGTPCQSFSVAGLRKGLDDPRGDLMLTFGAIADKYRPRWLVWENVPGVLSSNGGRDFGTFLGMLGQLGYGFAYRVLDAQHFGIPQRRRRVFVVGYLGDWRRAAAVLFEREGVRRDSPPSREEGQEPAGTLAARTEGGGFPGTDEACSGYVQPVARTVALRGREGGATAELGDEVAGCLRASTGGGDKPHVLCVAHGTQDPDIRIDQAHTLGRNNGAENAVCFLRDNKSGDSAPHIASGLAVRRLTPLECERLQGFPDNWTLIPTERRNWHRERDEMRAYFERTGQSFTDDELDRLAADGPRYKALGNSWAVPVARWIGERIQQVEET